MSALTEFLTARLAEDEADWAERHTFGCAWTNPCYEPPYEAGPDDALCDCRVKRAMADLASKRRIVALALNAEPSWEATGDAELLADDILCALALPYAEHPDFRPEWAL